MQEEMTSEFAHHCARRTAEGDSIPVVQGEEKKASLEPVAMGRSWPEMCPFLWRSINPEPSAGEEVVTNRRAGLAATIATPIAIVMPPKNGNEGNKSVRLPT